MNEFESEYHDYLCELGELSHTPVRPARADHVGENVYLFEWQMLQEITRCDGDPPNVLLAWITYNMRARLTQRHAIVAASFITWLGTNCGASIIERGRRLTRQLLSAEDAYRAAWAIENVRRHGQFRYVDHILASDDDYGPDLLSTQVRMMRAPHISAEDLEVIDHVLIWLASSRGQEFIARCDYLIQVRQRFNKPIDTVKHIALGLTP